ncbi:hypothetical protein RclHR1_05120005 [Rhizophagus clarus]|uniref:Kinase-like domain-containing protein n=1 Tax=Rhizophagus clarus TaxID=94130 RepID=A0A2Z6RYG6_9GLOM|nr:hypothetical protein RclHR1_05120005 [Rhizophagus clarus]GES79745.1 kinase-like domain-containing protein [Rhizophagus clarus]
MESCPECDRPIISFGWCRTCETNFMKGKFSYWSSGNNNIDKLIRHTQLHASKCCDYLEWIPFETLDIGKYIDSGGFSSIYSADWMEGPRRNWNDCSQEWIRTGPIKVALKRLNDSLINISSSYVGQIKIHHECIQLASFVETYGITKDSTSNYMIVMKYYEKNLYQYLDRHTLTWEDIIYILRETARCLIEIHNKGKIHKNLHGGNLFIEDENPLNVRIGDVSLYGPCYDHETNQIYGVLPYIAPEVLRGEDYTTASDIYSFGVIMNILVTRKRPWYNRAHNINLAKDICDDKRLEIPNYTPSFYAELMRRCWNNVPGERPSAIELHGKLNLNNLIFKYEETQLPGVYNHPEVHPEASYISRPLCFPELFKHDRSLK